LFVLSREFFPGKIEANYRRGQITLIDDIMPQNHPFALSQFFPWKYFL
jgi:hypothetical protein